MMCVQTALDGIFNAWRTCLIKQQAPFQVFEWLAAKFSLLQPFLEVSVLLQAFQILGRPPGVVHKQSREPRGAAFSSLFFLQ